MDSGHSCSYYCERPECIKAQRNELRDNADKQAATIAALRTDLAYYQAKWEHELSTVSKLERELAEWKAAAPSFVVARGAK